MHDLWHNFAVQEAKKTEDVEEWCKKIADVCRAGAGLHAMSDDRDGEGNSAREKYVLENIYRFMRQAVCAEELEWLIFRCAMGEDSATERQSLTIRGSCEEIE